MNFVAGERAVAAAHAEVHVHDQEVGPVDQPRLDEGALRGRDRLRRAARGLLGRDGDAAEGGEHGLTQIGRLPQPGERDLEHLGPPEQDAGLRPGRVARDRLDPEAAAGAEVSLAGRLAPALAAGLVARQERADLRRGREPRPPGPDQVKALDRLAGAEEDVVLRVDAEARDALELLGELRPEPEPRFQIVEGRAAAVAPVGRVEPLPEGRNLPQQPQRRALDLEHGDRGLARRAHRGGARHSGEHGHLAELHPGRNLPAARLAVAAPDPDLGPARDDDVEGIAAPVPLAHDLLARLVDEQPDVGADLLAVVVPPVDDDLEVELVLVVAVLGGGEVGDGLDARDRLEHLAARLDLSGHRCPCGLSAVSRKCLPKDCSLAPTAPAYG